MSKKKHKNTVQKLEAQREKVQSLLDKFIIDLDERSESRGQIVLRADNGTRPNVDSYWVYFDSRRYARLDVYFEQSAAEAYESTKSYLKWVSEEGRSMTPFIGYITTGGLNLYLYRKGPSSLSNVDFDHFMSLIWAFHRQGEEAAREKKLQAVKEYLSGLHGIINNAAIDEKKKQRLVSNLSDESINFSEEMDVVRFNSDAEKLFFMELLSCPEREEINTLCRYTSVSSLFRMLNDRKSSMLSIVCMNDISECSYVKDYLKSKMCEVSPNEYFENNRFFIQSCSDRCEADDLFMWNMYGDNAKGVCIEYEIDKTLLGESGLMLARISYGHIDKTHPELDLIADMMLSSISEKKFSFDSLNTWQHFFKAREYHKENEIRLLLEKDTTENTKWVLTGDGIMTPIQEFSINKTLNKDSLPIYPLKIKSIIVGPKCPNIESVVSQINALIDLHKSVEEKCIARPSSITSYR